MKLLIKVFLTLLVLVVAALGLSYQLPKENIAHVAVDAKMDGTLNAVLDLQNIAKNSTLAVSVTAIGSNKVLGTHVFNVNAKEQQMKISTQFPDIKPWSPESPNLYNVKLELLQNGKTIHEVTERIGFRTLEFIKNGDASHTNNWAWLMISVDPKIFSWKK